MNYTSLLITHLQSLGLPASTSQAHIQKLTDVIMLSALQRLSHEKGFDLSELNELDTEQKLAFITNHVTSQELTDTLLTEAEKHLTGYLNAISQN